MSEEDLESTTREATDYLEDQLDREAEAPREARKRRREDNMSDADLAFLRKRFPFLSDLSDKFVRSQTTVELLKMETTAMKMKMLEVMIKKSRHSLRGMWCSTGTGKRVLSCQGGCVQMRSCDG